VIVFAIDTSTSQGGIALIRVDQRTPSAAPEVLFEKIWTREKSHSELVTAIIQEAFDRSGLEFSQIDRIGVCQGPGSFTGIRIAINSVRSMAYVSGKPVYAFDTGEILAAQLTASLLQPLLVLVNAHKNLFYTSRFEHNSEAATSTESQNWQKIFGPKACSLDEIRALVDNQTHTCVGDGYVEIEGQLDSELKSRLVREKNLQDLPDPVILARLTANAQSAPLVWNEIQALYIRASEAEEKLRESP